MSKRKISITMEENTLKQLMHHAIDIDKSVSKIIEELVSAYLKKQKVKRNPS